MRPSSLLALPLLLTASVLATIVNAEDYTIAAPAPQPPPPAASPPPTPSPPPPAASPPSPPPSASPVNDPPAGWSPVTNTKDLWIRQVGRFAVRAYCLATGAKLEFVSVVSGQTQPSSGGKSYQLVITVAGPGLQKAGRQYSVLVWGILGTTSWQLWSFAPN
ncbi:hypothetical protein ACP4OV_015787 [Aristida adscensionis]